MKEYSRKRGKYTLPGTVYMKTIYQIRDYPRLKQNICDVIEESPDPGEVHVAGGKQRSVTESKAIRISDDGMIVDAIDRAAESIPEEYRSGVWNNVVAGEPYPLDASRSTYGMHKARFVYLVAKNLGWI